MGWWIYSERNDEYAGQLADRRSITNLQRKLQKHQPIIGVGERLTLFDCKFAVD